MNLFTRAEARDFQVLFARCVSGRPRGPAPPVVIQMKSGIRSIAATTVDGVTLRHTSNVTGERDYLIVLPGAVLAEVEAGTHEPVTLERQSKVTATVQWATESKPQTLPVELILPGKQHELPPLPSLSPVPMKFLSAVHECGRTAARDSGRFALPKIQIQGKAGRVAGTDGKVALFYGGFQLPFDDGCLVPALPVFGSKPLARLDEARLGRTETHLVVEAGPWSVWLPTDTKSRYPDVTSVIPRHTPTVVGIIASDAIELLKVLPSLPGGNDEYRPVTIDADGVIRIRGRDENSGETKEMILNCSASTGPSMQIAIDRRVLIRALSLGCHTLRMTPEKPLVAEGDDRALIVAPLEPSLIVPAAGDTAPTTTNKLCPPNPDTMNSERRMEMKPPEINGHTPPRDEPPDPLIVAEELRAALAEAATKATRLVMALKVGRKEKKALATVWAGLKQLNLGMGGQS